MTYERKDAFHRRARAEGYRARSAYKLIELDRRFRLLRPGAFVVDLGAWPGGWLQVIAERVGREGRVVGVDLVAVPPLGTPNVVLLEGDIRDPAIARAVLAALGRPADTVVSDAAPKLSGVRETDEARSDALVTRTLDLLPALLRPGGNFLVKLFMGPSFDPARARLQRLFERTRITRPEATRRGSAELYAAASGFRRASG